MTTDDKFESESTGTTTAIDWPYIDKTTADPCLPMKGGKFRRWVGRSFLKVMGYKVVGSLPPVNKLVAVMGPHTSNWDFVLGMGVQLAIGVKFSFMIKHTVFKPPLGSIIRGFGGIPINRRAKENITEQMIAKFNAAEKLTLVVTPEGTRANKQKIRSGFYRIANSAQVPILIAKIDYQRKIIQVGQMIDSNQSWDEVCQQLDKTFEGVPGKNGYWMDRAPDAQL